MGLLPIGSVASIHDTIDRSEAGSKCDGEKVKASKREKPQLYDGQAIPRKSATPQCGTRESTGWVEHDGPFLLHDESRHESHSTRGCARLACLVRYGKFLRATTSASGQNASFRACASHFRFTPDTGRAKGPFVPPTQPCACALQLARMYAGPSAPSARQNYTTTAGSLAVF